MKTIITCCLLLPIVAFNQSLTDSLFKYIDAEQATVATDKTLTDNCMTYSTSINGLSAMPVFASDSYNGSKALLFATPAATETQRMEYKLSDYNDPIGLKFGNTRYIGFAFKISDNFQNPTASIIFCQAWQGNPWGPPAMLKIMPGSESPYRIKLTVRNNASGYESTLPDIEAWAGSLNKNQWYQFVWMITPDYKNSQGKTKLWIDGTLQCDWTGNIGYTPESQGGPASAYDAPVVKFGLYQPGTNTAHSLLFDEMCFANSYQLAKPVTVTTGLSSVPGQPVSFITKKDTVLRGFSAVEYSVGKVNGATGYQWSYSGTKVTITPLADKALLTFGANATSGTLSVAAYNACGAGQARTTNIIVSEPVPVTYTIGTDAQPAAGGTVTGAGSYNAGSVVTVKAVAASGYNFTSWGGDTTGTAATIAVTVNRNKSLTANFKKLQPPTPTTRIEDNAGSTGGFCAYDGAISSNSGATNGKVINLTNAAAKGINWRVQTPAAGSYTLGWRYTNGSSSNGFTMALLVNGVKVNNALPFPKTSGTSVFATCSTSVSVPSGFNTIRLESTDSKPAADIDWIEITGNSPVAANCSATTFQGGAVTESHITAILTPNPAMENTTITTLEVQAGTVTICLIDITGRVLKTIRRNCYAGINNIALSLTDLKAGTYTISIANSNGIHKIAKLVKN